MWEWRCILRLAGPVRHRSAAFCDDLTSDFELLTVLVMYLVSTEDILVC